MSARTIRGAIQKRGSNDMEQKRLGFGFMRLPVKDMNDRTSIDREELSRMVDRFIECGFSYFDLAYIYHNGACEKAFYEAVASRYPRDKYVVATKMPLSIVASKEHQEQIFSEQLQNCGVDYFDYYLLHGMDYHTIPKAKRFDSFDFIYQKENTGMIRNIGFSFHDTSEMLDEILTAHPEVDFVQLQINYLDWDSVSIQSKACYEVAKKHNKKIIVMEPVKGGILANVPEQVEQLFKDSSPDRSAASWAVRFAASQKNVIMVLSGMSNYAQLDDNVGYMKEFLPFSENEHDVIKRAIPLFTDTNAIPCTFCRYCVTNCPKDIAIPEYFTQYNTYLNEKKSTEQNGLSNVEYNYYLIQKRRGKPTSCIMCRQCEKICPQHLPVTDHLKTVDGEFSSAMKILTAALSPQKSE